MTSSAKREHLVQEIKQIRKDIKRKHRALTENMSIEQEELEKRLEPITQPLKKLINTRELLEDTDVKMDDVETRLKKAKRHKETVDEHDIIPQKHRKLGSLSDTLEMNTDEGETEIYETQPSLQEVISTPEGRKRASFYIDKNFTGKLVKLYLRKLINDKNREIDHSYGVYFGNDDTLMIGNSSIQFDNNDIIINDTRYEGTPGLYELIFMRIPDSYSEEDLNTYAAILKTTNAHKQNRSDRIKSNKGYKYNNIIKNIFSTSPLSKSREKRFEGYGALTLNNNKPDYVYWNDPNELCDRLRLLIASQNSGHTGHENEIISIIEELREANIIN